MFLIVLVVLPLSTEGVRYLHDLVLLQRARQYLQEVAPAAYNCLDLEQLADGRLQISQVNVQNFVRSRFEKRLPAMLRNRLILTEVRLSWHDIPYDPKHWMGDSQPRQQPVVTLSAVLTDHLDNEIHVQHGIEMLLD